MDELDDEILEFYLPGEEDSDDKISNSSSSSERNSFFDIPKVGWRDHFAEDTIEYIKHSIDFFSLRPCVVDAIAATPMRDVQMYSTNYNKRIVLNHYINSLKILYGSRAPYTMEEVIHIYKYSIAFYISYRLINILHDPISRHNDQTYRISQNIICDILKLENNDDNRVIIYLVLNKLTYGYMIYRKPSVEVIMESEMIQLPDGYDYSPIYEFFNIKSQRHKIILTKAALSITNRISKLYSPLFNIHSLLDTQYISSLFSEKISDISHSWYRLPLSVICYHV